MVTYEEKIVQWAEVDGMGVELEMSSDMKWACPMAWIVMCHRFPTPFQKGCFLMLAAVFKVSAYNL